MRAWKRSELTPAIGSLLVAFAAAGCASNLAPRPGAMTAGPDGGGPNGNPAVEAIRNAEVGGAAGTAIGDYMDRQAMELRRDLEDATVERIKEGIKITFDAELLFAMNEAELGPAAEEELSVLAGVLRKYHDTEVVIAAHTDSTGPDDYNRDLSRRRAEAVSAFLASQGVRASRLAAVGNGEGSPVADNGTPRGRQQNRRVDIAVTAGEDLKDIVAEQTTSRS